MRPKGHEEQLRRLRQLQAAALRELQAILRNYIVADRKASIAVLNEVMPILATKYGDAAAVSAIAWYRDVREAQLGKIPYELRGVPEIPLEAISKSNISFIAKPLETPNPRAVELVIERAGVSLQRRIADQHRKAITQNAVADPFCHGWARVGSGADCDFCLLLISRGGVYTDESVQFKSHDRCNCMAAPVWDLASAKSIDAAFRPSSRKRSAATRAADNKRAQAWIAANL